MVSRVVQGSLIEYSIVPFNESLLGFSLLEHLKENFYDGIEGLIINDKFFSLIDDYAEPRQHWSIKIVSTYETEEPWLLINKRPGDLYHPMAYLTKCLSYNVNEYDIWSCEECDGPVAVITEVN
jgi:hypothetical protein